MMRALFSGVSGLKNHQTRMDVIGNNISNVNTYGFKTERVTFQDLISQTLQGASEPKDNVGGVNPKQVGLGMLVASIDKLMTQGSLQTTGRNTDVAITGEGFFILTDGDKDFYTRAGNFDVDKAGMLVNPANGMKVQGWNSVNNSDGSKSITISGDTEDIMIPLYSKKPAQETSFVRFKSNLNSSVLAVPQDATEAERYRMITHPDPSQRRGHIASMNVFDEEGKSHKLRVLMWKTTNNKWNAKVEMQDAEQLSLDVTGPQGQNITKAGNNLLELGFTPDGRLSSISDGTDVSNTGDLTANIAFRLAGNPTIQNIELRLGSANEINGITQFSSQFTTKAVEQDGKLMGFLESFHIDASGTITGVFSNGSNEPLAKIALANFTNPEGLMKKGSNNFASTNNSGDPLIGEASFEGKGEINAGMLEMSNVDLAEQFTDMIVTQRGFQANSRSITTSDQMLQELLTLKR